MKLLSGVWCIALLTLGGCSKKSAKCAYVPSTIVAPVSEQAALLDSLRAHDIQATLDPSGFYYKINDPGTGPKAKDLCTTVATFYRVGYFNGVGIDSTAGTAAVFLLGNVIPGWQKAIPLIGTNGNMDIYIPPSLAYGSSDYKVGDIIIPGNSYLVFHVVLVQVQ